MLELRRHRRLRGAGRRRRSASTASWPARSTSTARTTRSSCACSTPSGASSRKVDEPCDICTLKEADEAVRARRRQAGCAATQALPAEHAAAAAPSRRRRRRRSSRRRPRSSRRRRRTDRSSADAAAEDADDAAAQPEKKMFPWRPAGDRVAGGRRGRHRRRRSAGRHRRQPDLQPAQPKARPAPTSTTPVGGGAAHVDPRHRRRGRVGRAASTSTIARASGRRR